MILFRKSVIAIVALLLTMQGVSAVTMPLCQHGTTGSTSHADAQHHAGTAKAQYDHGPEASEHADRYKPDRDIHDTNDLVCDDCEFCALSCASTMPSAELADGAGAGHGTRSSRDTLLIGVTPHHLSKPPLLA